MRDDDDDRRPALAGRRSPCTPRRPWAPLSDAEWAALAPFVTRDAGPGRPLRGPQGRLDAMLRNTLGGRPWDAVSPEADGCKPDTLARLFRRWTHAGVWMRRLEALPPGAPAALRAMGYWTCRLVRRSI